jgi:hypothetical protein
MRLLPDGRSLRIADPRLNQRPGKQGAIGRVRRIAAGGGVTASPPRLFFLSPTIRIFTLDLAF